MKQKYNKMTTAILIDLLKELFGDKYDYSKVEYIDNNTKVCLICPIHGEFWLYPFNLRRSTGCPMCFKENLSNTMKEYYKTHSLPNNKKLTTDIFIERSNKVHNGKYIYNKSEYKNNHTKVCIICPEHGEFWQTPKDHMNGQGCPKCKKNIQIKKMPSKDRTLKFITKSQELFGDNFDYSNTNVINNRTSVEIKCNICGTTFQQTPLCHLNGQGCPQCNANNKVHKRKKWTTDDYIKECKEIHKIDYDYSNAEYMGLFKPIHIRCHKHGDFYPFAINFLRGCECQKCMAEINSAKRLKTLGQFLKEAYAIHSDNYDYSEFIYSGYKKKSTIICKKCGFKFEQTPNDHLRGRGCPHCHISNLETQIEHLLKNNSINFTTQKSINRQRLDFYLIDYNIAIECQGEQHFKPKFNRKGHDTSFNFSQSIERDVRKYNKCKEQNITILYFTKQEWLPNDIFENSLFQGIYNKNNVFLNENDLLNEIKKASPIAQ